MTDQIGGLAIKRAAQRPPARVVIYGAPGAGKTTLCAAEGTLIIACEDGAVGLECDRVDVRTLDDLRKVLGALRSGSSYRAIALDSITALERMVQAAVARASGKDSIAQISYGVGYADAAAKLRGVLDALEGLRNAGMMIMIIAHEEVAQIDDPESGSYAHRTLALDRRARGLVIEWANIILHARTHKVSVSEGKASSLRGRALVSESHPSRCAKVRAGWHLDPVIAMSRAELKRQIARSSRDQEKSNNAETQEK